MSTDNSTGGIVEQRKPKAIAIGASSGAIQALGTILPALREDFPLPIFIVVHVPPDHNGALVSLFGQMCKLKVKEAEDKEWITGGTIYVAPPNYHLLIEHDYSLSLSSDEPVLFSRPSIDVLFETVADVYGGTAVGIILTGANSDGANGLASICRAGGQSVVQSPDTAEADAMPRAALAACPVARPMALPEIIEWLNALTPEGCLMADKVTFLLVDDQEANLLAFEALLKRDGLQLLKARTGSEALELLLVHDVALAFVDVQMPEMDGFELAELMRGTLRTRHVPIIFVTAGNRDEQRRFQGYDLGAVDFLFKPIDPNMLKSKADVFFELARQRNELLAAAGENAKLLKERTEAERALRDADQRKDEFLAILAHELRNPLAPIKNAVQILNRYSAPDANFETARQMIGRQLDHMVRLIDDLLDVSRITSGKMELRRECVELKSIVDQAVQTSRPHIESSQHRLSVTLPTHSVYLFADPVRLAQLFSNLLNNAAKYTEKGGKIWLSAEVTGATVSIHVKDSGIGISAEHLPRIFELFSQVGSALNRSQGGLGIGLSLVKSLVEMHGGEIEARSEGANKGSEFIVRLPMLPEQASQALRISRPEHRAVPNARGLRILVADDNLDSAESLTLLLQMSGNEVKTALDGIEALTLASTFKPDVALLDIGMPNLDGFETCRRIRRQSWGKNISLIAMTGWGAETDRKRARDAGFDAHLVKPVDVDVLMQTLANLRELEAEPRLN